MSYFRRRPAETDVEMKLITALIVSTKFCKDIFPILDPEYFQISYGKRVVGWIKEYYLQYNESPGKHIQDIFKAEKSNIDKSEADVVEAFLTNLSEKYEEAENFNVDYVLDQSLEYLNKRALRTISENVKTLLDAGKPDQAEKEMQGYSRVAKIVTSWIDPFTPKAVRDVFDDEGIHLIKFPGKLGGLLGYFDRGWFVGFMAPYKRGKCVAEGSLVSLANGVLKPIEDVVRDKDKEVISLDGNEVTKGMVIDYFDNGIKPVYRVLTRIGREIVLPKNEPLLTLDGWIPVEKLKKGNRIGVPKVLPFPQSKKRLSEYKIRILAYLIAEGGLNQSSIAFTNKDEEMQRDFDRVIQLIGDKTTQTTDPITCYIVKNDMRKFGDNRPTKTKQWLKEINLKLVKSKYKELPDIVFQLGKEELSLFLSILFTCDGSIEKDGGVSYSSASKKLVYQVGHLLLRFGIVSKINAGIVKRNGKNFNSWSIGVGDRNNVLKFVEEIGFQFKKRDKAMALLSMIKRRRKKKGFLDSFPSTFYERIWREAKISACECGCGKMVRLGCRFISGHNRRNMPRSSSKQKRLYALADSMRQNEKNGGSIRRETLLELSELMNNFVLKEYAESNILWDTILSIQYVGRKATYDLAVAKHHNFIANDVVVHNTWWLQETAIQALLSRRKVVFVSLEMGANRVIKRMYKEITGKGEYGGDFIFPCFDCEHNQEGSCNSKHRTNTITLIDDKGIVPKFDKNLKYRPCTYCRKEGLDRYVPATWFESYSKDKITVGSTIKTIKSFRAMYGGNLRIKSYPRFSANISDIKRDLDLLEYTDNFVPDVIVVDYADILAPEDSRIVERRDRIDETWKTLGGMAEGRHCLVVTASQSTRSSAEKKNVKSWDVAEDIRKMAHVDLMITLNQTPEEKRIGIMRIGAVAYRDEYFDESRHVKVLQKLEVGQPNLDSEVTTPSAKTDGFCR